jgi:hypothetical protein
MVDRWKSRWLTLEALFFLSLVALLRRSVPMRVWSRVIGVPRKPEATTAGVLGSVPHDVDAGRTESAERLVRRAIGRADLIMGEPFTCLEKASAGLMMLRRRRCSSMVVIGLMRPESQKDRPWEAHAWLETSTGVIIGGEGVDTFKPVTLFAHEMSLRGQSAR